MMTASDYLSVVCSPKALEYLAGLYGGCMLLYLFPVWLLRSRSRLRNIVMAVIAALTVILKETLYAMMIIGYSETMYALYSQSAVLIMQISLFCICEKTLLGYAEDYFAFLLFDYLVELAELCFGTLVPRTSEILNHLSEYTDRQLILAGTYFFAFVAVEALVSLLMTLAFKRIRERVSVKTGRRIVISMIAIVIAAETVSFLACLLNLDFTKKSMPFVSTLFMTGVMALLLACLFYWKDKSLSVKLLAERQQLADARLREQKRQEESLLAFLNKMEDDMGKLGTYLEEHQSEAALSYINNVIGEERRLVEGYTENPLMDAAFSFAALRCKEHEITFQVTGSAASPLPVDPEVLTGIIYNLLNNAVEASALSPAPDRFVTVKMGSFAGNLMISVKNSWNPADRTGKTAEGTFLTRKDTRNHGYGTRILKELAEYCGGSYRLTLKESDRTATAVVMLPLKGD